jgi:hypothetical protein
MVIKTLDNGKLAYVQSVGGTCRILQICKVVPTPKHHIAVHGFAVIPLRGCEWSYWMRGLIGS